MPARLKAVVAAFPTVTKPRAEEPAATLQVPGLILLRPRRSDVVALQRCRAGAGVEDRDTCARSSKVKAGGLVEGRRLAKVVGLPGADRGTQKIVRALMTGYLLHMLTGDKAYRDFADPEVALPKAPVLDPFSDDPVDLENKVVALLKP